jgi:hypothetical protein
MTPSQPRDLVSREPLANVSDPVSRVHGNSETLPMGLHVLTLASISSFNVTGIYIEPCVIWVESLEGDLRTTEPELYSLLVRLTRTIDWFALLEVLNGYLSSALAALLLHPRPFFLPRSQVFPLAWRVFDLTFLLS